MGLGHVPPRPIPRAGPGAHIPRRQRREAGEDGDLHLRDRRRELGRLGEEIAASWLRERDFRIVARNQPVQRGEVDLIVDDGAPLVVEVRSTSTRTDPIDSISPGKRRRVRTLANRLGVPRVAHLGVGIREWGVEVHWVPE